MKTGLVLEGGAMRGMFTAGVLDVFMREKINFDGVIGVSAGAVFGVNLLSGQQGRVIRYNKRFNGDKNYMGLRQLLLTGNIVNTEYAYYRVTHELDVFDNEAYKSSGIPFYVVITDVKTGCAKYELITDVFEQMETLRASASMPFVSRTVKIDGGRYLDGAVADSIPFEKMRELGYDRLVVVLTRDINYRKKPVSALAAKLRYSHYPNFRDRLLERHTSYNETIERLKALEERGEIFVIRPSSPIEIGRVESDPDRLQQVYELGISDCSAQLDKMRVFLAKTC